MKLRYPSGQPIAENALSAIRFAGRTGFLARETWERFFAVGNPRWRRRQLEHLIHRGYLRPHPNPQGHGVFVLTERSRNLLRAHSWSYVSPVPVGQLGHDKVVGESLLALNQASITREWVTERELVRDKDTAYVVQKKDSMAKYPDAIFKVVAFESVMKVALEYERQRKASSRYKAILQSYAGMSDLSMVLFVCQESSIQKTIQGCLKQFGQSSLERRLAFASIEDWKKSPLSTPITIRSGTIRFGEVCSTVSERQSA